MYFIGNTSSGRFFCSHQALRGCLNLEMQIFFNGLLQNILFDAFSVDFSLVCRTTKVFFLPWGD